jgi:hypothetical protein
MKKKILVKIREEKDLLIKGLKMDLYKIHKRLKKVGLEKEAYKRQLVVNNIKPDPTFDNWT